MKNEKPTISEMVDIELTEKAGVAVDSKDVQKWLDDLLKRIDKLFKRLSKHTTDNNESIDCLFLFLEKYPQFFIDEYGTINRDMIKWALAENIKKSRQLIDKIQQIEKDHNLEIHNIW